MTEWAVELKDVKKAYRTGPTEVPALRGISLSIAAGEFLAIAGPSGSGKTTLLNIIGGLDRADTGEVLVEGKNLQLLSSGELARLRLQRVGFVFQTHNLLPVLSAMENAEFTLLLQGVQAEQRKERVQKLFSEIGLSGLENRRPGALSGGQRQAVAVARCVMAGAPFSLPFRSDQSARATKPRPEFWPPPPPPAAPATVSIAATFLPSSVRK